MSFIAQDIKSMITINIKPRHDGIADQYCRIFMVKILMVCSLIMSYSWFKDSINCIVPETHGMDKGFVASTCWIQGVYVYKELLNAFDVVAYYGMPKNMDLDGMLKGKTDLCSTTPKLDAKPGVECRPMTKTFFLQYQYMPFLIATLAVVYYLPYIAYCAINRDIILLRKDLKDESIDAEKILKHYFNRKTNSRRSSLMRVLMNVCVKLLYLVANLISFLGLNGILNGEYVQYGKAWSKWSVLDNHLAYDYMGGRDHPKPGNHLLPPFGYCELYESAKDVKHTLANHHKFVCELSQHILYQYSLLLIWFGIIAGTIVSTISLILLLINYVGRVVAVRPSGAAGKKIYNALSFRELEYLEFMRKRNVILYQEVLSQIKENVLSPNAPPLPDGNVFAKRPALYPSLLTSVAEG